MLGIFVSFSIHFFKIVLIFLSLNRVSKIMLLWATEFLKVLRVYNILDNSILFTVFEKNILEWLLQGKNMEENISIGYNLKKMIAEGIQTLKKKAEKYYGKHYIRSLLISESKNIR